MRQLFGRLAAVPWGLLPLFWLTRTLLGTYTVQRVVASANLCCGSRSGSFSEVWIRIRIHTDPAGASAVRPPGRRALGTALSLLAHPGPTRYLYRTERGGLCQPLNWGKWGSRSRYRTWGRGPYMDGCRVPRASFLAHPSPYRTERLKRKRKEIEEKAGRRGGGKWEKERKEERRQRHFIFRRYRSF